MNPKMPLVSIVIPIYNVEAYLPQCLDSVVNQTYENLEILLINDGSTDGCGAIIDDYAKNDNRIRVFYTENRGLASARNTGLDNAKGEFLSFIDSDDWMESVAIERLLNTGEKYSADIVATGRSIEYVGRTVHTQMDVDEVKAFRGVDIIAAYMDDSIGGDTAWNKLYRRGCFGDIRYPDGHNYEDVGTTWKIIKRLSENKGTVVFLPEELFHQRGRASSITHTRKIGNAIDAWIASYGKYQGLPEYKDRLIGGCFHSIGTMWGNYAGFSEEERKKGSDTVLVMHQFSKAHFHQVMKGKYSFGIKTTCLCSQTKSPVMMRMYYCANKVRRMFKNMRWRLFK